MAPDVSLGVRLRLLPPQLALEPPQRMELAEGTTEAKLVLGGRREYPGLNDTVIHR